MSINDWAAKAAERIYNEYKRRDDYGKHDPVSNKDHIAAIIETFAKPLLDVVHLARREHFSHTTADGMWFGCPRHWCEDDEQENSKCICGADEWNKRVDAALHGV